MDKFQSNQIYQLSETYNDQLVLNCKQLTNNKLVRSKCLHQSSFSLPIVSPKSYINKRYILIALFIIVGVLFCAKQIKILTQTLERHDTMLIQKMISQKSLVPPNLSFCFDIMRFVNTSKLFKSFPKILERTIAEQRTIPYLRNWTLHRIVKEHELGEKFCFSMLTVGQLSSHLVPLSLILDKCSYLTPSLTMAPCNESYFQHYIFNCLNCYEFTWIPGGRQDMNEPTFNSRGLLTPGFSVLRLLDLHLNLTVLPGINEIITMAHPPKRVPWKDESELHKLTCPQGTSIVFGLTYKELTKINLPKPFQTECTNQDLDFGVSADRSCWHNCSANRFSDSTDFYPRYAITTGNGDKKILDSYHKQEKFIKLIKKIQKECVEKCGRMECLEKKFPILTVYRPSRPIASNSKYVVIHYSPPTLHERRYQLTPNPSYELYWTSITTIIAFMFGVNYHSISYSIVDTIHHWIIILYLKSKVKRKAKLTKNRKQLTIQSKSSLK